MSEKNKQNTEWTPDLKDIRQLCNKRVARYNWEGREFILCAVPVSDKLPGEGEFGSFVSTKGKAPTAVIGMGSAYMKGATIAKVEGYELPVNVSVKLRASSDRPELVKRYQKNQAPKSGDGAEEL